MAKSQEIYGTNLLNHFDLPIEIKNIRGSFRYRFFSPTEQIDEENLEAENGKADPRYIILNWEGEGDLVESDGFKDQLVHRENLFFPNDLNSGFCCLTTEESRISQSQQQVISDASVGSKLDYLLKTVASNEFTEGIEENITTPMGPENKSRIPILDPTTNRPIQSTRVYGSEEAPSDIFINKAIVEKVIKYSGSSPISQGSYDDIMELSEIIETEEIAKIQKRSGKRLLTTLNYAIQQLYSKTNKDSKKSTNLINFPRLNDGYLENWGLIGYVVTKYRITNNDRKYMYSRIVSERRFRDPHVAYGATYSYDLRPVYAKYIDENTDSILVLASDESSNIEITCEELRAPAPPKNLSFEYVLNNNIEITWSRPESYVDDENQVWDTDDIKGYQIFIRNSLMDPYRLYRYFTFNNTFPRSAVMYANEVISDDYIISSEYDFPDSIDIKDIPNFYEYTQYTIDIRPNTDYYFALCSIDAHGNSSNYSAQYRVRRDNVTGEVDIRLLCPEGAPKQYPNLLIQGKLVQPSFKSSGFRYLDVYFAPDSQVSAPNVGEPAVNIQLFDLETQIEKNIVVTINEEANQTN